MSNCPSCRRPDMTWLCQPCQDTFTATLRQAPELYTRAHMELPPELSRPGERVTGGQGPSSRAPVQVGLLGSADMLARLLAAWETHVLILLGKQSPGEDAARMGVVVQRAADTILTHLETALATQPGIWHACGVERAAMGLRQQLGLAEQHSRLVDPCPECDRRALTYAIHSLVITCGNCAAVWTREQYLTVVDEYADGLR